MVAPNKLLKRDADMQDHIKHTSRVNSAAIGDSRAYRMDTNHIAMETVTFRKGTHITTTAMAETWTEIETGEEAEQYEDWIRQNCDRVDVILNELDMCCTYDWPQRLNSILAVVNNHNQMWMPMNTVIMEALSKCSFNVASLLIQQVDKHWLTDICASGKYSGGTVLHMVIAHGQMKLLKILLKRLRKEEYLRLFNTQANEPFSDKFLRGRGQNPVCLALLVGQMDIFALLIKIGGDLNAIDSISGNSTMHNLVLFASKNPHKGIEIMNEILEGNISRQWYCRKHHLTSTKFTKKERKEMKLKLLSHVNQDGYTPLALATKYMNAPMVEYLLNCEGVYKHTQWQAGACSSIDYDVTEIDPVATRKTLSQQPNIMELLVYSKEEDFAALKSDPLATVMQQKWQMYRTPFFLFAVCHVLFMLLHTVDVLFFARINDLEIRAGKSPGNTTVQSSNETQSLLFSPLSWYQTHFQHKVTHAVSCLACFYLMWCLIDFVALLYFAIKNIFKVYKKHSIDPMFPLKKMDHFDVVLWFFSVCLIASAAFSDVDIVISNVLDAMALLLGWYFCLFFARAFPQTCYITILVVRVIFSEFPRLLFLIILVLLGFSTGLVLLFATEAPEGFSSFLEILETMVFLGIGVGEIDPKVLLVGGWVSVIIYFWILSYYMFTSILLLNILVATMTETYARMSQCKHLIAMRLRVKSILTIERRIPPCFHRLLLKRAYTETDNGRWMLTVEK